jgi:hypothetical protein
MFPVRTGDRVNLSPWEGREHRYAFRDDIFRALLIVAQLINSPEYLQRLRGLDPEQLARWKFLQDIFVAPNATTNHIHSLHLKEEASVIAQLGRILFYAKHYSDPYESIIQGFRGIARLAHEYETGLRK